MSRFTAEQQDAIRRALRPLTDPAIDLDPVELLDDIYDQIAAGSVGITALAADVDALAKDGGHFTQDANTTTGLTFGWKASRIDTGLTTVTVSAGTLLLSASANNYVEVDRAGTVSANTSGFTSGKKPLWLIVTGVSSITSVTSRKTLLMLLGTAGVVGSMLSTPGATKEITVSLGTVSATSTFSVSMPANVGTIYKATLVPPAAVAASDTDYWTIDVTNKGAGGAGTTKVVDGTSAANTTKATGGTALAANVKRALTLNGTPGVDAALDHASEDVFLVTLTKTGSPAALTGGSIRFDSRFSG